MGDDRVNGKRFHYDGNDEGSFYFSECDSSKPDSEILAVRAEVPEPGVPVPAGCSLGTFRKTDDGHFVIEDVQTSSSGPPKVSSSAYRSGWEATFGKNGVN